MDFSLFTAIRYDEAYTLIKDKNRFVVFSYEVKVDAQIFMEATRFDFVDRRT